MSLSFSPCACPFHSHLAHVPLDPLGPVGVEQGGDDRVGVEEEDGEGMEPARRRAAPQLTYIGT